MAKNLDRTVIKQILDRTDLVRLSQHLGLEVHTSGRRTPTVLCPFHPDHRPSLNLFPARGSSPAHYHCFVCNEHGDAFDLVRKLRDLATFRDALVWLADYSGVALPPRRAGKGAALADRPSGLNLALGIFRREDSRNPERLNAWAQARVLDAGFLRQSEVYCVPASSLTHAVPRSDRETIEALSEAGLLTRRQRAEPDVQTKLDIELPRRDLFRSDRVIFSLRDIEGTLVGFAGRAVREGDQPKYLYTVGLRKSELLYRAERVFDRVKAREGSTRHGSLHLFLVEGLVDALRLESFGIPAVAILGSSLGKGQIDVLSRLAKRLEQNDAGLVVHVFLDTDEAGRRAAVRLLPDLLRAAAARPGFNVDLIQPPHSSWGKGIDPDTLFRDVRDQEEAWVRLTAWCHAPMAAFLAERLECAVDDLSRCWEEAPPGVRSRALRLVENSIPQNSWTQILARCSPFSRWLGEEPQGDSWTSSLRAFLEAGGRAEDSEPTKRLAPSDEIGERQKLLRALELAQASTQRREFPIDHGSWDRLRLAADAFYHPLKQHLEEGRPPSEPMLAVYVPKADGRPRLKATPCPEDLILQQYILNDLLREHPESKGFAEQIPAVRFWPGAEGGGKVVTTGPQDLRPINETVSFAYQVRMDVVNGLQPPGREGMFRTYFDCWTSFLDYVLRRSRQFRTPTLHVARLDIRGFYDNLSRDAVVNALTPGLKEALKRDHVAPLFRPDCNAVDRPARIVDWLARQSFGYRHLDPCTGQESLPQRADRGIPQGPDLSAYLANVSLFPFDRRLTQEIQRLDEEARSSESAPWVVGGIYARYVDDIIVVTTTAADLDKLRIVIESELAKLGLELNGKAEPEAPKTPTQFRRWLTSHRGAGFGASGMFGEAPPMIGLARLDFLADAGDVDRADALSILHSSEVDRVVVPREEIRRRIKDALKAPDLRYGEYVAAARGVWTCVVDQFAHSVHDARTIDVDTVLKASAAFYDEWAKIVRPDDLPASGDDVSVVHKQLHQARPLLVALDGLERLLGRRADRSPTLPASEQQDFESWRKVAARLVNAGLARTLVDDHVRTQFAGKIPLRHMVELRVATVRWAASQVKPDKYSDELQDDQWANSFYALRRSWISIAVGLKNEALLQRARLQANEENSFVRLHEAVARLSLADGNHSTRDPLDPVKQRVGMWDSSTTDDGDKVLRLWLPDDSNLVASQEDSTSNGLTKDALTALLNVSPRSAAALLARRHHLAASLFDGTPPENLGLLPVPPGIETGGLVGFDENQAIVRISLRTRTTGTDRLRFEPDDLPWKKLATIQVADAESAPMPQGLARLQVAPNLDDAAIARWLASAFRRLARIVYEINAKYQAPGGTENYCCVPTALNMLGTSPPSTLDTSTWHVVGYLVDRKNLGNQAFRRLGEQGFLPVAVPEYRADLWRVGTALADMLGLPLSTHDSEGARYSAAAFGAGGAGDWIAKAMLRVCAARLRGAAWFATRRADSSEAELPPSIEQLLQRLESFPTTGAQQEDQYRRLAHFLACVAWPRAQTLRRSLALDPSIPGAATALLARIVAVHFSVDETLATKLPRAEDPPAWAPARRPARAWYLVGQRLEKLSVYDEQRLDPSMQALAAGCFMLAFEMEIRACVIEQLSLLPRLDRSVLDGLNAHCVDLAEWNLDAGCRLVDDQELASLQDGDSSGGVRLLISRLIDISGATPQASALSHVTPLGWSVALGIVTGLLKSDGLFLRGLPGLVDTPEAEPLRTGLADALKRLAARLAQPGDPIKAEFREGPFDDLSSAIEVWFDRHNLEDCFQTLQQIDQATGVRVRDCESEDIDLRKDSDVEELEFRTEDGRRRRLTTVQVLHSGVVGDKKEYEHQRDGQIVRYRWSESWCGDRLLSVGLVHVGLSSLAGLQSVPLQDTTLPLTPQDSPHTEKEMEEISQPDEILQTETVGVSPSPPQQPTPPQQPELGEAERHLRDWQEISWNRRRSLKASAHARVALLQWDAGETYRHPLFECCFEGDPIGTRHLYSEPSRWTRLESRPSPTEHRRRRILERILSACHAFGVEILVIPEYTMRAETVLWLGKQLPSLAPRLAVWAGTYRHAPDAPKLKGSEAEGWHSVLNVLLEAEGLEEAKRIERFKKYPSTAATEIFRPTRDLMLRLGDSQSPNDAKAFVIALICSEIFLASSPANLLGVAQSLADLWARFNKINVPDVYEWAKERVRQDVLNFASATSLTHNRMPATILLVPAMTRRAQDFVVLGQASFFAAGITTVFCNAVHGKYGVGKSCFIGCDSWDLPIDSNVGMPTRDPYHGIAPGIFRQSSSPRGWLEKGEQALVIADIDPRNALAGSPRPQALAPALQLVAHLPILESWKPSTLRDEGNGHVCCPYERRPRTEAWNELRKVLALGKSEGFQTTADDVHPKDLLDALELLEELAPQTGRAWLRRRLEAYGREHKANPQAWPPPVALDWLWVDLGDTDAETIESFPKLDVPPYSALSGDVRGSPYKG